MPSRITNSQLYEILLENKGDICRLTEIAEATRVQATATNGKVAQLFKEKAEKEDLETISNRLWWLLGIFAVAFLSVLGVFIEANIK